MLWTTEVRSEPLISIPEISPFKARIAKLMGEAMGQLSSHPIFRLQKGQDSQI